MFENLIKRLQTVKSSFSEKKIFSVFIGQAISCPCIYFYNFSKEVKNADTFLWGDPNQIDLPITNLQNGLFIYAHGDLRQLESFYWTQTGVKKFISDKIWQKFSRNPKLTYFHVCYGSQIIKNNRLLSAKFPYWVSYAGEIVVLRSSKVPELEVFYKDLIMKTYEVAFKAQSPQDFQTLIMEAHHSMKANIKLHRRLSNMLVATLGNNMQNITHST
jgi:hypothetical protein